MPCTQPGGQAGFAGVAAPTNPHGRAVAGSFSLGPRRVRSFASRSSPRRGSSSARCTFTPKSPCSGNWCISKVNHHEKRSGFQTRASVRSEYRSIPLGAAGAKLNQPKRQQAHIGGRQVQALGAGRRPDGRGVTGPAQAAETHRHGDEAAQRRDAFFDGGPIRLNRICRQVLGHSKHGVLHARVLLKTQRELAGTAMRVKQIALGLGFADTDCLSRFFRHRTGHTPTGWRALDSVNSSGSGSGAPA